MTRDLHAVSLLAYIEAIFKSWNKLFRKTVLRYFSKSSNYCDNRSNYSTS